jgi:hypothetical protein
MSKTVDHLISILSSRTFMFYLCIVAENVKAPQTFVVLCLYPEEW